MTPRVWAVLGLLVVLSAMAYVATRRGTDPDRDGRLDLAMAEARAGRVDSSAAMLAETPEDAPPDAQAGALRVRLIAAKGNVRFALMELVKGADQIADVESMTSVLGTLHESLERAGLDPRSAPPEVVQYAFGFGSSRAALDGLPDPEPVVLEALHAYETGQPVDIDALERLSVESNELPRFIRLAKVRGAHAPAGH